MSILKRQVLFVLFAFAATLCVFAQNKTITGLVVDGNGESIIVPVFLSKGQRMELSLTLTVSSH